MIVVQMDRRRRGRPTGEALGFGLTLRDIRETRPRLSQSRLAELAGLDHSYLSRIEAGQRVPSRQVVLALADALAATDIERDRLLIAAGFMPEDSGSILSDEPVLLEALDVLLNPVIPREVRDDVRAQLRLIVRQAQRTAGQ